MIQQPHEARKCYNLGFTPTSEVSFRHIVLDLDDNNPLEVVEWIALFYFVIGRKNCEFIFSGEYLEGFFGSGTYLFKDGEKTPPPNFYKDIVPEFMQEYRDHFQMDVYRKKHLELKQPTLEKYSFKTSQGRVIDGKLPDGTWYEAKDGFGHIFTLDGNLIPDELRKLEQQFISGRDAARKEGGVGYRVMLAADPPPAIREVLIKNNIDFGMF